MRHDEQVRLIKLLIHRIDAGLNVDAGGVRREKASSYTSAERAQLEWECFFRTFPQIIGMSGDLPRPGTYVTRDDFGLPILATRAKDGKFRAFANVCRHRGTILEESARGEKSRFSCPFHAWTYDATGALIAVPKQEHFGNVDKACLGLVELPAEERRGLLWVHPQPGGHLDAASLLAGLDEEFSTWDFARMVHIGDDLYETDMNWKLAIDTFGETYHFDKLHQNTLAPFFHGNVQAYDTYGRNHRMTLCLRTIEVMRNLPEQEWNISMGAFPVYYLFPNIQVNVGMGFVILVRVYPLPGKPAQSVSRISFYAQPELIESDPVGLIQRQRAFADIIRDEDYVAAAASQRGAESGFIDTFIFGRNEPALHHYHNTYRAALGLEPLSLEPV